MVFRNLCKRLFLLVVAVALLGPLPAHAIPKINQPLPAFTVTTPNGQQMNNRSYSGRVLLLVFSTDYCSACKKAVPAIGKLADRYGKQGFHVLGLFSGFGMDNDDLKKYMTTYGVTYPMALFQVVPNHHQGLDVFGLHFSEEADKSPLCRDRERGGSDNLNHISFKTRYRCPKALRKTFGCTYVSIPS